MRESYCVPGSICVAHLVLDNLKNTWTLTFPGFSRGMFAAKLCDCQSGANGVLRFLRKLHKDGLGITDPK